MGLIVDANCAIETLCAKPSEPFAPVVKAILNNTVVVVYGGKKLKDEYFKLPTVWRFILMLDRAGKALAYSDKSIDAAQEQLKDSGLLCSDDPHIIALAQISGARLLCSKDKNLHIDFLSPKLISNPRGAVYQNSKHAALLKKHRC